MTVNPLSMQAPIQVGTVLQNRYQIISILGQTGFGITYLAEDLRHFNELCAITEIMLKAAKADVSQKVQELFVRGTASLYQINHPQIPRFREKFTQEQGLFLVRDYISGPTYHTLLNERVCINQTFTEQEVLGLICSLLPVLKYIHKYGITHRHISPHNLVFRDIDQQPVLINFGVSQELATKLANADKKQIVQIGNSAYSPIDQFQSGKAYPHSDLYALAVTAIVLLTGKEPENLFNETKLTWNWQQYVQVNPQFAQVLNRMLSYIPGDRYQKAKDVLSALESIDQSVADDAKISDIPTVGVDSSDPSLPPNSKKSIPPAEGSSILDSPFAIAAIGSVVVIVAGFGSWAFVNSLRSPSQKPPKPINTPQNFPSRVLPGVTSTPTPTEDSFITKKPLNLDEYTADSVNGTIKVGGIIQYTFSADAKQVLTVEINQGSEVLITVLTDDGESIGSDSELVSSYQGVLAKDGNYLIQLTLSEGIVESNYSLDVALEDSDDVKPTETPTTDLQEDNPTVESNSEIPQTTPSN